MKMILFSALRTSAALRSRSRRSLAACLLPLVMAGLFVAPAHAQTTTSAVPGFISYQGKVSNADGSLVGATGGGAAAPVNRIVTFRIWSHQGNSTFNDLAYSEQQTVTISQGEFSVLIGQGTAVAGTPLGYSEASKGPGTIGVGTLSVFGGATRFLGVTIDDGNAGTLDPEISPRQQLVTSAYAFRAKYAESVGSNGASTIVALDSGNVGIGTASPNARLDVNGGMMIKGVLTNGSDRPAVGAGRLAAEINGYSSGGPFNDDGFLRLSAGGGTNGSAKTFIDLSGFSTIPDMSANLVFGTGGAERLRINNNGVDVNGGFVIKGTLTNSSTRPAVGISRLAAEIAGYGSGGATNDDGFLRLSAGGGTSAGSKAFIDLSGYSTVGDMNQTLVFGTGSAERMRIDSSGKVGIGLTSPFSTLTIGNGINDQAGSKSTLTFSGAATIPESSARPGIYHRSSVGLGLFSDFQMSFQVNGGTSLVEAMRIVSSGNVGIGTTAPNSRLNVVTASNTYGLTVGDGTREFGAYLSSTSNMVQIGSKSNHPVGFFTNGGVPAMTVATNGNIGIGDTTPASAKLVVGGGILGSIPNNYTLHLGGTIAKSVFDGTVSIWATNRIVAAEFHALSDQRIKTITGRSDGRTDLATIMNVEVTDYVYRDRLEMGSAPHKKVIAQQVEKVFPQAVRRSTNAVPDIYKPAELRENWIVLATDLKQGDRVKLITGAESAVHEVVQVEPGRFRTAVRPAGDKVFVYGREVKDFRTVDYEAISMLNVSATQEIKRENDALRAANAALEQRLAQVEAKDRVRDAKLAAIEKMISSSSTVMALPAKPATANGQQ